MIRKRRAMVVVLSFAALSVLGRAWVDRLASAGGAMATAATTPSATVRTTPASGERALTADESAFFESKIRPVFVKECYGCHSAKLNEVSGGLLLDSRQGIRRGGERGPALVPGNVEESLLIHAIRYTDEDLQMPPKGKLSDATIKDFETWVKMGAPDPREGAVPIVVKAYDTQAAKSWWAYQPLKRTPAPTVRNATWPKGELDRYVLAGLEAKQIKPNADADKATLLRRLAFDLIGLPPSPEDVDAFLRDSTPTAYTRMVDRLLASPQFGERWGRHWLDVARYAESSGKDVNMTYPHAWRYRDYVIDSFAADKPFDQFIKEQLAGDLLPASTPRKQAEQLIATGFLAIGAKSQGEQIPRQFALDVADEQVGATAQAFMGLTVSCARCHDHKFDPITQRDYYSMAGIFLSTKTKFGTLAGPRNNNESEIIELPAAAVEPTIKTALAAKDRDQLKKDVAAVAAELEALLAQRGAGAPTGLPQQIQNAIGRKAYLESQANAYDAAGKPKAYAMGVGDRPPASGQLPAMGPPPPRPGPLGHAESGFETIADCPLFFRGEMTEPRDRVPRGAPSFLAATGMAPIPPNESGRRELANWIASPKNPLTARVIANRLWLWLMGQGIVTSVDNFGTMGAKPSNQALLDFLANRLIENNWSLKKTIREIVLSHTYQLASTYSEISYNADPQNTLNWRHSPLRLDAESLRDSILTLTGQLDLTRPVGSMVAQAGDGSIAGGPPFMRIGDPQFLNAAGLNRSVYLPAPRDIEPDAMAVFDYPDSNATNGQREVTIVPSQALYLMNNDYVRVQARRMAVRLIQAFPGAMTQARVREARVNYAFRAAFGRPPEPAELAASETLFNSLTSQPNMNPQETMTAFCLGLMNTAEFRFVK